jgi:hypothetical protein
LIEPETVVPEAGDAIETVNEGGVLLELTNPEQPEITKPDSKTSCHDFREISYAANLPHPCKLAITPLLLLKFPRKRFLAKVSYPSPHATKTKVN